MSPSFKEAVSHFLITIRSPLLNVGAMESDSTTIGVKPARLDTLPSSLVASVVNANNAASSMIIHRATLITTVIPFFAAFIN